jgi:hypothetical protein
MESSKGEYMAGSLTIRMMSGFRHISAEKQDLLRRFAGPLSSAVLNG